MSLLRYPCTTRFLTCEPESYLVSEPPICHVPLSPICLCSRSYKFRQASDFWYLTGFEEPDSALILGQPSSYLSILSYPHSSAPTTEKTSSPRGFRMLLYSTGKDPSKEKWDGAFTRFQDVLGLFGADEARPLENFADDLRAFAARSEHVYVDTPPAHQNGRRASTAGRGLLRYLSRQQPRAARSDPDAYLDAIAASKRRALAPLVGALRSVKSTHEVGVMKASADISARAHAKVREKKVVAFPSLLADFLSLFLVLFFLGRQCVWRSMGCQRQIYKLTLSIYVRGAAFSALRTFPSLLLGKQQSRTHLRERFTERL